MSAEKLGLITKHVLWDGQDDSGSRMVMLLGYLSEPSLRWSQGESSEERQAVKKT